MYRPSPFLKAVNQSKKSNTTSDGKKRQWGAIRSPFFFFASVRKLHTALTIRLNTFLDKSFLAKMT